MTALFLLRMSVKVGGEDWPAVSPNIAALQLFGAPPELLAALGGRGT